MVVALIDSKTKKDIEAAIEAAEKLTSGEIRVHIKLKSEEDIYLEAKKIFQALNMHKTKDRNSVLIYVGLTSKKFAILGDIGIHEKVGDDFWISVRDIMKQNFERGNLKEGLVNAVMTIGGKLKEYYPLKKNDKNELPDIVTIDN